MPGAAGQAARDRNRLQASEAAVTSDVIEFQLARQRIGLTSRATIPPLSEREREVVALVAQGRTDGEIGEALFISKKTASVHVANIKGKLGASSRVEIAMLAVHLGLVEASSADKAETDAGRGAARATVVCPFKGLASFDLADAPFFFGRERVVAELVAKLAGSTFLGIVGPSGSGKSSVVRAGLVSALQDGVLPGSDQWAIAVIRPGRSPLAELRRAATLALQRIGLDGSGDASVGELLDRLPPGRRLVVVVDQFEELFTVGDDERERTDFVNALVELAGDGGFRGVAVVAIRADFYGRCADWRALAQLLSRNNVLVGPMTGDELARAIELPARAAGLRVDAPLTEALVADVLDEPGGLPLLSTTLLDLWQQRTGRTIRLETYERIGRVSGAVARLAESAFGRLTPEQQQIARAIFLRLAAASESDVLVRRPVALTEFDDRDPDIARVLAVLVESRLVTVSDGSVEVAHEALLREWPRLREWLEEDAEGRRLRKHLTGSARGWESSGEDRAELYRGARLAAALEWSVLHESELNQLERRFLRASRDVSEEEIAHQRRTNRRLRMLLGGAILFLVLAIGGAWLAARAAEIARSRELAAAATAALDTDPTLARLLALAALEGQEPSRDLVSVLRQTIAADHAVLRYTWSEDDPTAELWVDLDPSGTRIAASGLPEAPARHLEVVDTGTNETWTFRPEDARVSVGPAFFSRDGSQVIVGTLWDVDGVDAPTEQLGAFVLDAATGRLVDRLDLGPCGGFVAGVSATHILARFLALEGQDVRSCARLGPNIPVGIGVIERETRALRILSSNAGSLGGQALSGDGRRVAFDDVTGGDFRLVVAEVASGNRIHEITPGDEELFTRDLNEDGSLLLAGDRPIVVLAIDDGGERVATYGGHAGQSFFAEFGAGDTVFSTARDATLRHWDGRTGDEIAVIGAAGSGRVAVAGDGRRVLVANTELGLATLVDLQTTYGETTAIDTCPGRVASSGLEVSGGLAVVLHAICPDDDSFAGRTTVVELASGTVLNAIPGLDGQLARISPDGERLLLQEGSYPTAGALVIRDLRSGDDIIELEGLCSWDWDAVLARVPRVDSGQCAAFPETPFPFWALAMRWSPDGSMVFAADNHGMDGYWAVWNARSGTLLHTESTADGQAFDAIFTSDSRELVVAGYDTGVLRRYSTESWEHLQTSELDRAIEGRDRLWFVGYTPDGGTLLAVGGFLGAGGGSIHWLDAATLQPVGDPVLRAHDSSPNAIATSPDGSQLVTGAFGDPVRVWDVISRQLIHEIPLGDISVQGVAFLDDRHIVVALQGGRVLVLTLDPAELIQIASSQLVRGFTRTECERYGFGDACPTLADLSGG